MDVCTGESTTLAAPRAPRLVVLHALAAGLDFDRYFRWRRTREGDPFFVRFPGFGSALFTGTVEGAREIFRAPPDALEPPRPNPIEPLVGTAALILAAGERHRRDRALLAPAFHGARIRAYGTIIRDSVLREMSGAEPGGRAWRPGVRIDSRAAARAITLRVILAAVFGVDSYERRAEYTWAVGEFLTAFSGPLMLMPSLRHGMFGAAPWDRFVAARARLDRLILDDIARRRTIVGDQATDILGMLLSTRYDDGTAITDDELCEQLRTLLVAGHETTATSLVWALFHLHREPGTLARLRAELRAAGPEADPAELARLPYLDAVCHETLRLHPAVPIVLRRLTTPYPVRGVALAAGDTMGVAVPLLHTDPRVWPQPERFRPERFLERRYGPFEFAPFGGGHRRCVGAALADYELRIALATIVNRVRLRLPPRYANGRAPMSVPHNIATGPHRPIPFDVVSDLRHEGV
ncbi:cytochrome P450 [Nocardia tenerifensis]|uniref:Cytochrome P450 n=1 Tax=Nocardia tenerifensis TaxID=228006 RepID=A0A318K6N7_9NOCA|nr:cytochrome P450 [Nocardia tenerifensis]PXX65668.1 cytochrome P450 [Nocardia tenerifensis]